MGADYAGEHEKEADFIAEQVELNPTFAVSFNCEGDEEIAVGRILTQRGYAVQIWNGLGHAAKSIEVLNASSNIRPDVTTE